VPYEVLNISTEEYTTVFGLQAAKQSQRTQNGTKWWQKEIDTD